MSMPPIINGNLSKISPATKDVFIECTATDLTKAHIVLQTVCAMFSQYDEELHYATHYATRYHIYIHCIHILVCFSVSRENMYTEAYASPQH